MFFFQEILPVKWGVFFSFSILFLSLALNQVNQNGCKAHASKLKRERDYKSSVKPHLKII